MDATFRLRCRSAQHFGLLLAGWLQRRHSTAAAISSE
jgi:hypothetical protein